MGGLTLLLNGMPQIPNPKSQISNPMNLDGFPIYLPLRVGTGKVGRRIMEATNMMRRPKVRMYRSGSASPAAAAARDRVSFGIIISSTFSSFQPPIGLQLHKQKKEEEVSQQRVTSFEWVMIRRNLNLISLRRFGGGADNNKGIPELLLLRDPQQQQQQHHLGCCVGEESSSGMGDADVKLIKQEEDGSMEEEEKKKIEQGGEDLGNTPLKSSSSASLPPEPPEKPLPGDCCGNGCIPCVWDTYNDELEDYNKLLKAYNSQFKP